MDDLCWRGKRILFTWHFKEELDKLNKPIECVPDWLETAIHKEMHGKINAYTAFRNRWLCISYAEHEDSLVMIHIKPTRKTK